MANYYSPSHERKKFHFAMFPWFAAGHLTPFFHVSTKLAERGHKITFLLPKKAITLLQPLNTHSPDLITFHPLSVPHVDGLPPGTETASDIPISSCSLLAAAFDLTRDQVEVALSTSKPDFILYDFAYWIPEIARPLGIISIFYNVVPSAAMALVGAPSRNVSKDNPLTEEQLAQPPPGYPSKTVVIHGDEAKSFMFVTMPFGGDGITFYDRMNTATSKSDAIAMRTCKEVDGSICDYVGSQFKKPVFYTGPALPDPSLETKLEARWAGWLNRFDRGSVVFCAFGSQCILEKDQFQELLLGFELTNLPFLVALKPPTGASTVEEAFPNGFEERTRGRGEVYGGWIQQPLILNHPSVGCFVTHCGFGSMWESLMCDSQLVLAPQYQDHFLSARLLGGELKVGVQVERDDHNNGWYSKESFSKAIKSVMIINSIDHQLGDTLRKNHAHLKEKLTTPNFMSGYIDDFVRNLEHLRSVSSA